MDDEFNKFGEWEEGWRQVFEDSDHTPPSRVWQGLENSLMEQQIKSYRRKLLVYQWLAAASVLLLGFWAGWWLFFAQPQATQLAVNAADPAAEMASSGSAAAAGAAETGPGANDLIISAEAETAEQAEAPGRNARTLQPQTDSPSVSQSGAAVKGTTTESVAGTAEDALTGTVAGTAAETEAEAAAVRQRISPTTPTAAKTPVQPVQAKRSAVAEMLSPEKEGQSAPAIHVLKDDVTITEGKAPAETLFSVSTIIAYPATLIARKAAPEVKEGKISKELPVVAFSKKEEKKRKTFLNGSTWIGASFGSTFFDPNVGVNASNSLAWTNEPVSAKGGQVYSASAANWDEKEVSLPSINFSLDAAFRVGQRWMLRSSLEYGTFKVSNMTGTYTDESSNTAYPLYYTNFSYDKLQIVSQNSRKAAPINALTTYSFVSIPLGVNYVLFERNIGLSVGTGLSTDIFLGGRIMDQERLLEKYEIGSGPDSPFNRFHFNGLLSAQLFYRAGPDHLFTIEPTYKYSLTSFNKKTSYFNSRPSQLGVAVGFRYILR